MTFVDEFTNAVDNGNPEETLAPPPPPPSYKVLTEDKIPISKSRGKLWQSRIQQAEAKYKSLRDAWDEAIAYYNNSQDSHRAMTGGRTAGNAVVSRRKNEAFSEVENVIFGSCAAMLPAIYAKNPVIETTSDVNDRSPEGGITEIDARLDEKLITELFRRKHSPGVNLKPKMRRGALCTMLTNRVWFECSYTQRTASIEQAHEDVNRISEELANAESAKDIERLEGELIALDKMSTMLQPAGPNLKLRMPHDVIVDPMCEDPWLSDANWVAIKDKLPTAYIMAMFSNEQDGRPASIFEPTHILPNNSDQGDDINSFHLFNPSAASAQSYGYTNEDTFDSAKYTEVVYVWDKVTRRVELYNTKDYSWPIWVWNDPYNLDSFFPLTPLWFHENPISQFAKGEISHILDQVDAINEINSELRIARQWACFNIVYDQNKVSSTTVDKLLSGDRKTAIGVDVPEGTEIKKLIDCVIPPGVQYQQLFDTGPKFRAIERITPVSDVLRGAQFKTNTTNQAVETYNSITNQRLDERIDAVEDAIGDIGWKLIQLCRKFMPPEMVYRLTGLDVKTWRPYDQITPSINVVGGSTNKPTSQIKKKEALELAQVLGQFVNAAPGPAIKVTLKVLSSAFDEVIIAKEDWDEIDQAIAAQMQRGNSAPDNSGQPPQSASNNGPSPEAFKQLLAKLPPNVRQKVESALQNGATPQDVIGAIREHVGR